MESPAGKNLGKPSAFNLKSAIREWRRGLRKHSAFEDGHIAELENHLQEEMESLQASGIPEAEAFRIAVGKIGSPAQLSVEISKNTTPRVYPFNLQSKTPVVALALGYLKAFLRSFKKSVVYLFIAVLGLSIGYGCTILIGGLIRYELSFDNFHTYGDRIFRVTNNGNVSVGSSWGPELKNYFPEVESVARLFGFGYVTPLVEYEDKRFEEPEFCYADASVFNIFTWELLQGRASEVLQRPFTLVISEGASKKYFGDKSPLGKTLRIDNGYDYEITGVMKDMPRNSGIQVDFLASYATIEALTTSGRWDVTPMSWTNPTTRTYVLLKNPIERLQAEKKFAGFLKSNLGVSYKGAFKFDKTVLQPLADIHFSKADGENGELVSDTTFVVTFSAISLFILVSAIINFVNLFTVYSQRRFKEVGMRKVLGATKKQLTAQFLGESLGLSLMALVLAIVFVALSTPYFVQLTNSNLLFADFFNLRSASFTVSIALLCGVVAGIYPSIFISGVKASDTLRGNSLPVFKVGVLQKSLIVFQFGISTMLIANTLIVYNQLEFLRSRNLGFDQENTLIIPLSGASGVKQQIEAVRNELLSARGVTDFSSSHSIPGRFLNKFFYSKQGSSPDEKVRLADVSIDFSFIPFYKIKLLAGRTFDPAIQSDSGKFILNSAAAKQFGWMPEEAIGKNITWELPGVGFEGVVVGVVDDFNYESLHTLISPTVFHISRFGSNFISLKVQQGDLPLLIATIERTWEKFEPHYPFNFYFLDENLQNKYIQERQLGKIFSFTAGLAILIACLGLFGLAAYNARQKRKEIGIRKVLGADVNTIFLMSSRNYLYLVMVATAISLPLSFIIMARWLEGFAYKIPITAGVFVLSAIIGLLIAFVAIAYHTLRAAYDNPVEAIRKD